jgi:bifunctional UDP-N-acetylglucosamine pyrophosphorylase/glucosamine-1-phosphate N-acetyltransferase
MSEASPSQTPSILPSAHAPPPHAPPLLAVVLGAGKGTRMKSARPKVLHAVGGRSMLGHVLALTDCVRADRVAVVVGPDMDAVRAEALQAMPTAAVHVQANQRGTADAVLAARETIAAHIAAAPDGHAIVLYADTPLITADTIARLRAALDGGAHGQRPGIAVLGFHAANPTGYGRLLTAADGTLAAIREEKDASEAERAVDLCNSGVMAFALDRLAATPSGGLLGLLDRIGNANAKGEYYLTDAVEIARSDGVRAVVVACPEAEVQGVNARDQLAAVEATFQARARARAMAEGVTMIAPETVYFAHDTILGRDVTLEPNIVFGPGVTIEDDVTIRANCHIEGAIVRQGARVGPFARLRPGADLGPEVHVGNFVEVKAVSMGPRSKANHLAYLGDGRVGADANIGAGTIFCNYDGFRKHRTVVGDGAFVGSNSALVAPVEIGAGAYVGSGSVITKSVAPDALALERSRQETRPGWAAKFRALMSRGT